MPITNSISTVHITQMFDELPIINAPALATVSSNGAIMSYGSSFVPDNIMSSAEALLAVRRSLRKRVQEITAADAVISFAKSFDSSIDLTLLTQSLKMESSPFANNTVIVTGADFAVTPIEAFLGYYQTPTALVKVWSLEIQTKTVYLNVFVDSSTGEIVGHANRQTPFFAEESILRARMAEGDSSSGSVQSQTQEVLKRAPLSDKPKVKIFRRSPQVITVTDPAADPAVAATAQNAAANAPFPAGAPVTTYKVVPFGMTDMVQSNGLQIVQNPEDQVASPLGWHDLNDGTGYQDTTAGNNIIAVSNPNNAANPLNNNFVNGNGFNFNFDMNTNVAPLTDPNNVAAAVTNMFYVGNMMHDLFFRYGFDEASGNFQASNMNGVGKGKDPVVATAQDGSGVNNANFATPPDGTSGRMRMFLFNKVNPNRDGALENDIVSHEVFIYLFEFRFEILYH
jgi:hypothetical protein